MKSLPRVPAWSSPVEIAWSHAGVFRRVIAGSEVAFERRCGDDWIPDHPTEGAFAAAAAYVGDASWLRFLEYLPGRERAFVGQFRFNRMEALQVIAHGPELLPILEEIPALTLFVSAHVALRGSERAGWDEIRAVFERGGVFGVLEWLGLPATRQTLTVLGNLADPEVPRRLLGPLRAMLWHGPTVCTFERADVVTDLDLVRQSRRLAA